MHTAALLTSTPLPPTTCRLPNSGPSSCWMHPACSFLHSSTAPPSCWTAPSTGAGATACASVPPAVWCGPTATCRPRPTALPMCWCKTWGWSAATVCCCVRPTTPCWRRAGLLSSRPVPSPWPPCRCCAPKSWVPSSTRRRCRTRCATCRWRTSCNRPLPPTPYCSNCGFSMGRACWTACMLWAGQRGWKPTWPDTPRHLPTCPLRPPTPACWPSPAAPRGCPRPPCTVTAT
jgi:hypothetical protein